MKQQNVCIIYESRYRPTVTRFFPPMKISSIEWDGTGQYRHDFALLFYKHQLVLIEIEPVIQEEDNACEAVNRLKIEREARR